MSEYSEGGYIPGSAPQLTSFRLHPDECVLNIDRATGRVTCRRFRPPDRHV